MEIKHLRELRNFTQSYVAEQLSLSLSGYSKIERNETDISTSYINKVAHREFSEEYVKQLKEEIKYLRKIVDSRIMIQQKHSENNND